MASSSSFFLQQINDDTTRMVKLSDITKLSGQDNYNVWASTMTIIWRALKVYDLVVEGKKPEKNSSAEELKAFESLKNYALTVYLQVVSPKLIEQIIELQDPHEMWIYLKQQFYRDTAFALVSQMRKLINLINAYDPSTPISDYIQHFESEWLTLHRMSKASTDSYRQFLSKFLEEDKAKRDFLLALLSEHHENAVDNITTKDDLTFSEVKQRLMNLNHKNITTRHSAFMTKEIKGNKSSSNRVSKNSNRHECSWCKKHNPGRHIGHLWNKCKKLKESKTNLSKKDGGRDEAHMTNSKNQEIGSRISRLVPDL